ncbi:manganese efflux pump MntP [Breznakiella homolactica]|uniref:Putative manganese efflux pump MntP n=1 Tax=Breznakiella homolactica TaxID=2798577 RepID=A0A7T7XQF4_9SPIR|nr:manganese efflux pump MntP family protein [Breznakiella homolactica]QQO10507.1 manganese efflux pump MntP family protein [Breznakiella homolactica]
MLSIVLIAVSLSMDAFAVSVSSGICIRNLKPFHAVRGALFFGVFQFIMPVIGWYLGNSFRSYIEEYDHWIAFVLLAFIGFKMIKEGIATKKAPCPEEESSSEDGLPCGCGEDKINSSDIRKLGTLVTLSIATSIDALAVGLSFSVLNQNIWGPAAIIGVITFVVCLAGFEFGKRIGVFFEKWAQIIGGVILVAIGVRILAEHLFA